jgi:hypothetical protein
VFWGETLGKVVKLESKQRAEQEVYTRLQSREATTGARRDSSLTPELKAFIDRVVVPILVKSYIEKLQNEKSVACSVGKASSCGLMPSAPQAEVAR